MDLMRLLRSLEEFLYELVGWLVFYPRTFWRVMAHPGIVAQYTQRELAKADARLQFQETVSPVLMLILSVVLTHGIEMALKLSLPETPSPIGRLVLGNEQGLLLFRCAVFCIYALGAALGTLLKQHRTVDRDSLREPFSVQAYLVCPFLVGASVGGQCFRIDALAFQIMGGTLACASVTWYVVARVIAYRSLYHSSWLTALGLVLMWLVATTAFVFAITAMLAL